MSLFYWLEGSSKNLKLIKLMLRKQSKRAESILSPVLYIALVFSNLEFLVFVIKKKKLLSIDIVCFFLFAYISWQSNGTWDSVSVTA